MTAVAPWGENEEDAFDQGLVELGLLIISGVLFFNDLITSGTIRFFFISPPPITFPALVVA